jgi:hypothetical protein
MEKERKGVWRSGPDTLGATMDRIDALYRTETDAQCAADVDEILRKAGWFVRFAASLLVPDSELKLFPNAGELADEIDKVRDSLPPLRDEARDTAVRALGEYWLADAKSRGDLQALSGEESERARTVCALLAAALAADAEARG